MMMIRMMLLLQLTSFKFGNSFSIPKFLHHPSSHHNVVMMIRHSSQRSLQPFFTTIYSYDLIQVTQLTKYQNRYHHGSNFQLFQSKSLLDQFLL